MQLADDFKEKEGTGVERGGSNSQQLGKWLWMTLYRGVDKSLARPGRKQATLPAFYGTWRFITTFTRVHHLSLP